MSGPTIGFPIKNSLRVQGNQIARQRQVLADYWYDNFNTDWILWIDSDVVLNLSIWEKLCKSVDKEIRPMVTGIYFIAKEEDGSLPVILPCIFDDVDEFRIINHHPLPDNQLIKVDSSGMGLLLMHRSVIQKLRTSQKDNESFFAENNKTDKMFISEDISFFRKCKKLGIPLYAHTGAIAKHIKKMSWDTDYYNLYWNNKNIPTK